jgi:hypothetical protein
MKEYIDGQFRRLLRLLSKRSNHLSRKSGSFQKFFANTLLCSFQMATVLSCFSLRTMEVTQKTWDVANEKVNMVTSLSNTSISKSEL